MKNDHARFVEGVIFIVNVMADDSNLQENLKRKIKLPQSSNSVPKKKFRLQGESAYDFSKVPEREKRPFIVDGNKSNTFKTSGFVKQVTSTTVPLTSEETQVRDPASHVESKQDENTLGNVEEINDVNVDAFLNEEELYLNKLYQGEENIKISDGIGLFMVLPDLDYKNSQLKKTELVLLERKTVSFKDDEKWIASCSCQPSWTREIRSAMGQYNSSYLDFLKQYPKCLHRRVATAIFAEYDVLHQLTPGQYLSCRAEDHMYEGVELDLEEAIRIDGVPVVRVWSESNSSHGLVSAVKKKLYCYCCKKNYCSHVKKIKEVDPNVQILEELLSFTSDDPACSKKSQGTFKCHSQKRISFSPSEESKIVLRDGIVNHVKREDDEIHLIPKDSQCKHCGGDLDQGDPELKEWVASDKATLVTNTYLGKCVVYYRPCLSCDAITLFDGLEECILNMGTYLVGHDILRSYMHSFLHGRRPLYTFYSAFVDFHGDCGNDSIINEFSYHKMRNSWLSFFNLLDIDLTEGFSCPDCENNGGPEVIICDGTSLSFQRRMWTWQKIDIPKNNPQKKRSGFSDRIFLPNPRGRNLLHRYASGGEMVRGKSNKILNPDEKTELFRLLKEHPALFVFIKSVDDGSMRLPSSLRNFVTSIASSSPVCGYIHPNEVVCSLMEDLISGCRIKEDLEKWQQLHHNIPILFEVLEQCSDPQAPNEMIPLLEELLDISLYPFQNTQTPDFEGMPINDDEMAFFPTLPPYRPRGVYPMDTNRAKPESCSKKYKGHPSLLPGVFTVYCPHGVCYGFQVMQSNESPNIPFTIFRTRFRKAPKIVVYDNACSLHAYCISRDPLFFKDTIFLVDRLHWDNHTGCSYGYCLNIYPLLNDMNSQANEQANAGLKRIKDQLSYMTADNFMKHCSFFLWNKNVKKISQN